MDSSTGALRVRLGQPATLSAACADRTVLFETPGDIHYDTWGGQDHYRVVPPVNPTFAGTLWRVEPRRSVSR